MSTNTGIGPSEIDFQPPLTPTFISPRLAPQPPQGSNKSFKASFHTVFRTQQKPPSLKSDTASTITPSDENNSGASPHPSAYMPPIPVVKNHSVVEDDDECPVCLEPLSFSFRLPGEKPHIVPECGHALHEACFTAVYGPPPNQQARALPRKTNLGVCGVCRRPMKVGDGDGGKSNKLAALTGMGDSRAAPLYPGRDSPASRGRNPASPYDPNDNDPLDHTSSASTNDHPQYIVTPSIQVRPEFSSLTRTNNLNQPLTCIVVIELPGKRAVASVPGPVIPDNYGINGNNSNHSIYRPDQVRQTQHEEGNSQREYQTRQSSLSPASPFSPASTSHHDRNTVFRTNTLIRSEEDSPFTAITEDLRNRIIDWKGHPLSDLGPLQMYDLLSVRRDSTIREFYVYLFKEAIICVMEEKKRGLGRLLSNASSFTDPGSLSGQSKGVLRLKGRIYVRHIKNITASSAAGEMSLTIDMEDELASFILIFKEQGPLEAWKNNIQALVNLFQAQNGVVRVAPPPLDIEEFGGSAKAMRMLSGSTQTTLSSVDSLLSPTRSTMSSSTSQHSGLIGHRHYSSNKLAPLGEDEELSAYESSTNLVTPHTSSGPSNSLSPLPHPALDLILVISLPPPTALPSTAQLKVRVIKATLDFLVASLGPKDRLSLVSFEVGVGGKVRKCPFLSVTKAQSRQRLEKFINELDVKLEENQDEFLVREANDEKTDVVTAVNNALDIVLQRKSRNSISAMILVSDAADSTRRAQMDLVLARAEAANVPIHSFGYGRSHDPASLWLMSNHTSGTYTFVKDWYDLRDCVAGCVGGMMSIGLLNMRLHLKIVDSHRFRIRKVSGGPSSILSTDGQNVDVDVGELRYGERKEMLIELELDNSDQKLQSRNQDGRPLNATDQFVQSMGLGSLSIDDSPDFVDGMMDRMIDEVPVFEVDGSFFDPSAAKNVSRLAHPVLLTVTLLPLSASSPRTSSTVSDPVIVRRRMELLASDMITRALVLVSRRNFPQAQKIMGETRRILHTVMQSMSRSLAASNANGRNRILTLSAVRAMQSILHDLQILSEAMDDNVEMFAHDQRNFGAQQAMILRDQKSWSGRSATERLFWTTDNSIELASRSTDWVARE